MPKSSSRNSQVAALEVESTAMQGGERQGGSEMDFGKHFSKLQPLVHLSASKLLAVHPFHLFVCLLWAIPQLLLFQIPF